MVGVARYGTSELDRIDDDPGLDPPTWRPTEEAPMADVILYSLNSDARTPT